MLPSSASSETPNNSTTPSLIPSPSPLPSPLPSPSPSLQSARIKALPQGVVNLIAAGEVVHRPVSIAKELIENSLDAQSTAIDVRCAGGGLTHLSITDDGIGIHPSDLLLAAKRFSTSKLRSFGDLKSIKTFGFRGEALASASMVGRLSIVSRRRKDQTKLDYERGHEILGSNYSNACAYKLSYLNGGPTAPRPLPVAGKVGTCVKLEDLFYNLPSRRRSFADDGGEISSRKVNQEYNRILNVVQRYAVEKAREGVGFVCRKKGGNTDLNTTNIASVKKLRETRSNFGEASDDDEDRDGRCQEKGLKEEATKEVIRHIFGSDVARELLVFRSHKGDILQVSMAALKALQENDDRETLTGSTGAYDISSSVCEEDNESKSKDKTTLMLLEEQKNELGETAVLNETDFGANIASESEKTHGNNKASSSAVQYSFAYKSFGMFTNGSYCVSKSSSAFILFINSRLVECGAIRRAVEEVYCSILPNRSAKPFIYLSLEVPGPHIDVNVHPTKREVAFLHEDKLCDALASATRDLLTCAMTSKTFYTQTLLTTKTNTSEKDSNCTSTMMKATQSNQTKGENTELSGELKQGEKRKSIIESQEELDNVLSSNQSQLDKKKRQRNEKSPLSSTTTNIRNDPKHLVRTNTAAHQGALEPFLVSSQTLSQTLSTNSNKENLMEQTQQPLTDGGEKITKSYEKSRYEHAPDCEFSSPNARMKIDMSKPGAFASMICRCQIKRASELPPPQPSLGSVATEQQVALRPKKLIASNCSYSSIENLRMDLKEQMHLEITAKIRDSVFVGCISKHRSLLQSGIELLMINHSEFARELFYQIAVTRFGDFKTANIGGGNGGLNVKVMIEQALQFEEVISSSEVSSSNSTCATGLMPVNSTNSNLANQASQCLSDNAGMLNEYFSICLEKKRDHDNKKGERETLMLTGLPVLLDGHSPPPHALPIFLLRLATEVDWMEEQPCFEGICKELGLYYARIPMSVEAKHSNNDKNTHEDEDENDEDTTTTNDQFLDDEKLRNFVQHTIFPAIKFTLVPPVDFASDGSFCTFARLSDLYKAFERC